MLQYVEDYRHKSISSNEDLSKPPILSLRPENLCRYAAKLPEWNYWRFNQYDIDSNRIQPETLAKQDSSCLKFDILNINCLGSQKFLQKTGTG